MVEFVLLVPLFIAVLLAGAFLTELLRGRFAVLQTSRFAAWELAARPPPTPEHARSGFSVARRELTRAAVRFSRPSGAFAAWRPMELAVRQTAFPLQGALGPSRHALVASPAADLESQLRAWGFNLEGEVQVEAALGASPTTTSLALFDGATPSWTLRAEQHLLTDTWALADGSDARMRTDGQAHGGRAGIGADGEHPLHRQVARLTFTGFDRGKALSGSLVPVLRLLGVPNVQPFGTFVVAHRYQRGQRARACPFPQHPVPLGLNDLSAAVGLDHPRPNCFDTAPARDTVAYRESQYLELYRARGSFFMGCEIAMGRDPSALGCGGATP